MQTVHQMPYGRIATAVRPYSICRTSVSQLVYGLYLPLRAGPKAIAWYSVRSSCFVLAGEKIREKVRDNL